MQRYSIQLRTETRVWETLSVESSDHTNLRIEVAKFVGELLRNHAGEIWADEEWRVDVTDERGLILYVMEIKASNTSATMPLRR